jgi:hypothetical protein
VQREVMRLERERAALRPGRCAPSACARRCDDLDHIHASTLLGANEVERRHPPWMHSSFTLHMSICASEREATRSQCRRSLVARPARNAVARSGYVAAWTAQDNLCKGQPQAAALTARARRRSRPHSAETPEEN